MSEASGFGYPNFRTLAMCVPWTDRPLPPELPLAFKACAPPMNSNTIYFETHRKNIDEARNWFAEAAIQHNAKYLFMWDEDVLVPPHALRELCYVMDNWPKVGVIGGIYCLKTERPEPLVFKSAGSGPFWDWKVGEVFECGAIGMGCTLIRTELFKDIEKPWFRTVDDLSSYLDNIPAGEQWTEDLYFAKKVVESKKWKIMAHGGLVMPHIDVRTGRRYELPPDSKPARHLMLPVGKKKILDIGPGEAGRMRTQEGTVVTVDIRDGLGVDYRCDFRKMPFANEEFDIVHCAIPGQRVLTPLGWIAIENLCIGDRVVGRSGVTEIIRTFRFPYIGPVFSLKTSQGEAIVTGEHPIATPSGWTNADQLRETAEAFVCPSEIKPADFVDDSKILSVVRGLSALGPNSAMSVLADNPFFQKLEHQFSLASFAYKKWQNLFNKYATSFHRTMHDYTIALFIVLLRSSRLAQATAYADGLNQFVNSFQDFRITIDELNAGMYTRASTGKTHASLTVHDSSQPSHINIARFHNVSSYHYHGPVFNLETGDNTFFLEGLLTHNCSQGLEHIPRRDVSDTLDEWIRVLKKDGELRLAVPNLEWACKKILAGDVGTMVAKQEVSALDVLYAQQQYAEDFHQNGWTPKTLEKALRDKGFKEFVIDTPSFLISMRAWKIKPKKKHA